MRPNVNVIVGGPINGTAPCQYKTKILKANLPFKGQVENDPNTKFVIKWDFDLKGQTVTIPENCILYFDGGTVNHGRVNLSSNCSVIGNGAVCEASCNVYNVIPIHPSSSRKAYFHRTLFSAENADNITIKDIIIKGKYDESDGIFHVDVTYGINDVAYALLYLNNCNNILLDNVEINGFANAPDYNNTSPNWNTIYNSNIDRGPVKIIHSNNVNISKCKHYNSTGEAWCIAWCDNVLMESCTFNVFNQLSFTHFPWCDRVSVLNSFFRRAVSIISSGDFTDTKTYGNLVNFVCRELLFANNTVINGSLDYGNEAAGMAGKPVDIIMPDGSHGRDFVINNVNITNNRFINGYIQCNNLSETITLDYNINYVNIENNYIEPSRYITEEKQGERRRWDYIWAITGPKTSGIRQVNIINNDIKVTEEFDATNKLLNRYELIEFLNSKVQDFNVDGLNIQDNLNTPNAGIYVNVHNEVTAAILLPKCIKEYNSENELDITKSGTVTIRNCRVYCPAFMYFRYTNYMDLAYKSFVFENNIISGGYDILLGAHDYGVLRIDGNVFDTPLSLIGRERNDAFVFFHNIKELYLNNNTTYKSGSVIYGYKHSTEDPEADTVIGCLFDGDLKPWNIECDKINYKIMPGHISSTGAGNGNYQKGMSMFDQQANRPKFFNNGSWFDADGRHFTGLINGDVRPLGIFNENDFGFEFFDNSLNKPIFASKDHNNRMIWVDGNGFGAALNRGTTEDRPLGWYVSGYANPNDPSDVSETQDETHTVPVYTGDLDSVRDIGYKYFDTDLWCNVYAKTISNYYGGTVVWVREDGFSAAPNKGATEDRPKGIAAGGLLDSTRDIGFEYFDTELGLPIYATAIDGSGIVTWKTATGANPDE